MLSFISRFRLVLLAALLPACPARAQDPLQVMSFNLRYSSANEDQNSWKQWDSPNYSPQRRQFACTIISNRNPDIIGFQEGEEDQLDYLASQLPAYAFERQLPSGGGGTEHAAFAYKTNRIELLDRDVFSLGPSPGGGDWNNPAGTNFEPYVFFPNMGLNFPRIALWGRFRWRATGQEFLFTTTHFDFNNDPQVGSARLITANAQARNDRMPSSPLAIVVGDFNSTQANNDWLLFTGAYTNGGVSGDYTDSWWQVHGTWTDSGTIHGYAGGVQSASLRIDWILHRGGFAATQMVIVTDSVTTTNQSDFSTATLYPSDHYPVLASLQWPSVAVDTDHDGLPDDLELSRTGSLPADPDSDGDGLLDGQEDLNGDGTVDGGESDALSSGDTQRPTDIRNHSMNGVPDFQTALLAQNGLKLYARFDGRYLYVATQDAGEGSDHFLFLSTNPAAATSAPWTKSGQVAPWIAYLADENDSDFCGWFDASGTLITNLFLARATTYYQNGGYLEGVIDLAQVLGAGFTHSLYLAAAPYSTADGGALVTAAQVPEGNGDGNLTGIDEFALLNPGDADGDGINDSADPDVDGDGLNDTWTSELGLTGGSADDDSDGASNLQEYRAGTNPTNPASVFRLAGLTSTGILSTAVQGHTYVLEITTNQTSWSGAATNDAPTNFPESTLHSTWLPATSAWLRLRIAP